MDMSSAVGTTHRARRPRLTVLSSHPPLPFFAAQTTAAVEGVHHLPAVAIGLLCCFGAMYRRRAFGRAKIVEAGPGFRTRDPRVHTWEYRDRV